MLQAKPLGAVQQEREATKRKPDAVCSVFEASRAGPSAAVNGQSASGSEAAGQTPGRCPTGKGSNSAEKRCSLFRACSFPSGRELLNNDETCCYPPSDLQRQGKATDDRVRRLVSSSRGSCNEHGGQEFFPHVIEHTSGMCPTGA